MQTEIFDSAFEFSAIGTALVSLEGKWLRVNRSLMTMLGYSQEELLQLTFQHVTHPDDLNIGKDALRDLLSGKVKSLQFEKRYINKNGSVIYAILSTSLVQYEGETPSCLLSQTQDITELKEAQLKLYNNAKLVALGEMSAGIAHEINNPLTIIGLNTKALEVLVQGEEIDREMLRHFTYKISDTVKRISCIVSSLRKYSTCSSRVRNYEDCKVHMILEDALGMCHEKFKAAGVTLNVAVPKDLTIECNQLDISQVLINLINNSFYAIQNADEKFINVTAQKINETVVISVMDSGPEIPKDIRSRLLEPFFTTKPMGEGTGLGLSISRSIVQSHEGSLYMDNSSQRTNFVLKLPVKQNHLKKSSEAAKTASRIFAI